MVMERDMTEKAKTLDVNKLLKDEQPFKVRYAGFCLTLKILTREEILAARLAATEPGDDPKNPKISGDKLVKEMLRKGIIEWTSIDGGKVVNDGKEFKCTPENIIRLDKSGLPGIADFIVTNCTNATKMYRTLEEHEIKN
jgi:hypothetical protein